MKIISPFKDYYDGIAGAYKDKDDSTFFRKPAYERILYSSRDVTKDNSEEQSILIGLFRNNHDKPQPVLYNHLVSNPLDTEGFNNYTTGKVSFCGRLYPFYLIKFGSKLHYIYSASDYKKFLLEVKAPAAELIIKNMESNSSRPSIKTRISDKSWNEYILGFKSLVELDSYKEFKTPIAAVFYGTELDAIPSEYSGNNVIINPNLSEMNFQSVMDPYTAYQELSTYLSNELANVTNSTPLPITDKLRAETKGFNEWSFRRHATEDKKYKKKHG